MRPNGGILMRFAGWPTIPILGVSFDGASPTSARPGDGLSRTRRGHRPAVRRLAAISRCAAEP
ncbi:PE-PPE domain-containing protein, partial [Mycolicibacterium insubricum]|uniref:PE-PPE domain-containing protein n=1 Tax=Mycolicibacterium insubricum TaxID=444597 RepID=UPI0027E2C797